MPELMVRDGWSAYRALTNLSANHARGTISDTPARGLQWVYAINQDMGIGYHHWLVDIKVFASDGETVLFACRLDLPITVVDLEQFGTLWYIQNEKITTSVPEGVQTLGGESQQPLLDYPDGYTGILPVHVDIYSAHYLISLPAGAILDVTHAEVGASGLRFSPIMTSVLAGGGRKKKHTMIDPVDGDQYLPRIQSEMLVVRTTLHDGPAGPRAGLSLTYAGGVATVSPGSGVIGHQSVAAAAALTLDVPTSGTHYLFIEPTADGGVRLASRSEAGTRTAGWCLGRVKSGRLAPCSGVLVADGVTEVAEVARKETGMCVLRYDTATADDVRAVSRDRGVTWTA